jgi:chromosome segregation ATPase
MPEDKPSPFGVNNGVYHAGGTSYVGNQAVGPNAHADSGPVSFSIAEPGQRRELDGMLAEVERLLSEHADELHDAEAARGELRRLREELEEARPEPRLLRRALDRLASFAQQVTPLATAVGQLGQAVSALLNR